MQLDMYSDKASEKLLFVERGRDIRTVSIDDPTQLIGLAFKDNIDPEYDALPNGIDKDELLEHVRLRGYFKTTYVASIKEIDG